MNRPQGRPLSFDAFREESAMELLAQAQELEAKAAELRRLGHGMLTFPIARERVG